MSRHNELEQWKVLNAHQKEIRDFGWRMDTLKTAIDQVQQTVVERMQSPPTGSEEEE